MKYARISSWAASLVALAALAWLPRWVDDYWRGVALGVLSWVALTQSWTMFSGLTGYVSLGHAVFYGLGAYVLALLWTGAPAWELVLAGGGAAGLLALVIGYPALRVRGPYFVILTLGLSEFVKYVVIAIEAALESSGRLLFDTPDPTMLYYGMLALAAVSTLLTYAVSQSRIGAGLRAIREDETAAATLGVPVVGLKVALFVLSAIVPGMVGAIWVMRSTYFEPQQMFSPTTSFTIVTMAVIGGSDSIFGPILGATFIAIMSELLWARAPELYLILLGAMLIVFVLFIPEGIVGRLVKVARSRRR